MAKQSLMILLKNLLKSVLPASVRKGIYLSFNTVKIKTIDKLLFPELRIEKKDFNLYKKLYPFVENNINIDDIEDEVIRLYMNQWYNWTQEEFILQCRTCLIEPEIGWAFSKDLKLNYYSLGISRTLFLPKPSFIRLISKKKIKEVDKVISLRDSGEENYFHFYNDVLAKLFFLKSSGIDLLNYTILISGKTWNKVYFQYYFNKSPFLKSLNWLVQNNEYVLADSCIFCKPLTHRKPLLDDILSLIPLPEAMGERRVYLKRSKQRLRYIENAEDVEGVILKYGFEIIDADDLSIQEQILVFSQSRYLVAIHGAGLTNMIYRRNASLDILELFPPATEGYLPFHYIMLSKIYSFNYRALIGEAARMRFSSGFYVDPAELDKRIRNLLVGC